MTRRARKGSNGTQGHRSSAKALRKSAPGLSRAVTAVEERPLLALGLASGVGALVGSLMLPGVARVAFGAALGYAAAELCDREGSLDLRELLDRYTDDGDAKA